MDHSRLCICVWVVITGSLSTYLLLCCLRNQINVLRDGSFWGYVCVCGRACVCVTKMSVKTCHSQNWKPKWIYWAFYWTLWPVFTMLVLLPYTLFSVEFKPTGQSLHDWLFPNHYVHVHLPLECKNIYL